MSEIGQRIAERIDALEPRVSRGEFAERVGMTPDALSRALNGKRGFSAAELALITDEVSADMYELVTGAPNPSRLAFAARHSFDTESLEHVVPSRSQDDPILRDIEILYRQAELPPRSAEPLPATADEVRHALGKGFVRPFSDRIEQALDIDVLRLGELGTAYSFAIEGRSVIAIPARGNWFRENWDLAHELGHLCGFITEQDANRFAADLLLPESEVRAIDWESCSRDMIADFLWDAGVSTAALRTRLHALRLPVSGETAETLSLSTQSLLRHTRTWSSSFGDEVSARMSAAATRRFPLHLQEAHELGIEEGRLGPDFLAWMRGIDPRWVAEAYETPREQPDSDELARALGFSLN